jgi:hypothetical protein
MTIYTIGTYKRECYGHGDYGIELTIRQNGKNETFHPVFKSKEAAKDYLDTIEYNSEMAIVPLELLS